MTLSKYLSGLGPRMLGLVFFGVIFGGSCLVMSYLYVGAVKHREADTRLFVRELATAAAGLVDMDLHEQLVRPEQLGSDEYRRVLGPLVKFHLAHPNIQYLWTRRVAADGRQWQVMQTSTDERIRNQQIDRGRMQETLSFLEADPMTEAGRKAVAVLRSGAAVVLAGIYQDRHGEYLEARAPLMNREGKFVGYLRVDYALDSYRQRINEVRITGLVALGLALLVSGLVASVMAEMRRQTFAHLAQVEQAEAEMRVQRDSAAKANAAKSELLAIASHDLKNPLSAIAGMSGLLVKMIKARPDHASRGDDIEALETISASARHMSEIVRGILMNEGLEHGGLTAQTAPTELVALAAEVVRFNEPSAKKKGIRLSTQFPAALPATVDRKLMREAFDNYLSNAIKYSPPGKAVTVALRAMPDGVSIEYAVQDEGPGLSAEDQAKLYRKFTRLTPRPTGGESSTGLGLSIVKVIADLHGGQVGCVSAPGSGAQFWLRVPVQPPAAA
jgi:signal transduction histidine kinase